MPSPSDKSITLVAEKLAPFHAADERLGKLLALCVGRLMLKAARQDEDLLEGFSTKDIKHVADWLKAAVANEEAWLGNVDEQGRTKKLLKFGSMAALVTEANNAMLLESKKLGNVKLRDGDETLHYELTDGAYLAHLQTPAALDRESSEMQHCIGNGGYDDLLDDEDNLFLSLRDRHGNAHATLQIEDGVITQLYGKQNELPVRKYIDMLIPYMKGKAFEAEVPAGLLGYVIDMDGNWHPVDNLPDGLTIEGYLDLSNTDITKLPARLTVRGTLRVNSTNLTELPRGLKVTGDLHIGCTGITELPEGLKIGGSLYAYRLAMKTLPRGLIVGKHLYVMNTELTVLPDDLSVGGDIVFKGTGITELPDIIDDRKRIVTNDGPMSAAKFRATYSASRTDVGQPVATHR